MCEIKTAFDLEGKHIIICTPHEGDFKSAKTVTIFDDKNDVVEITDFEISETRQCFNSEPIAPILGFSDDIDERFLKRGNRVVIH